VDKELRLVPIQDALGLSTEVQRVSRCQTVDGAGGIVSSREWGSPANDVQVTLGRVPLQ
jgi:hypothetical protein